jgi:hypothetical protein
MIFATYNGPAYGSFDYRDSLEVFASEKNAKAAFRSRQRGGMDIVVSVQYDDCDFWVNATEYISFDRSTDQDFIDLYRAEKVEGASELYHVDDMPYARLTVGPRGGIRKESF